MFHYPLQVLLFLFSVHSGLIFGSFAGVLITRLPKNQNVLLTRSHCHYCHHNLTPIELIPLISWLIQMGHTRCCSRPLPLFYPSVELVMAAGFIFLAFIYKQSQFLILPAWGLWFASVVLAAIDLRDYILPDTLLLVFAFSGLLLQIISGNFHVLSLVSAFFSALFFWLIWKISSGRAMGFGDVKLVFAMGIALPWQVLIISLYLAFLTGATVGVILIIIRHKTLKSALPFGPFLLFGFWITLLFSSQILRMINVYL